MFIWMWIKRRRKARAAPVAEVGDATGPASPPEGNNDLT
jgi:hypothetical protein